MDKNRLQQLINWFIDYDIKLNQYNRAKRLGIECKIDIAALDKQAEAYAAEIKEIRKHWND